MTTPNQPTPDGDDATPHRSLRSRVPTRLFGGRLRTTTAVLVIAFVGLLMLYGQRADYYKNVDAENAAASATRTAAPRTTEDTPEYTEPTRTSTPSSSRPSTSTTTSPGDTGTSTDESVPTTTTTQPGLQLPTIPGIVLPGQTPTTTPAR